MKRMLRNLGVQSCLLLLLCGLACSWSWLLQPPQQCHHNIFLNSRGLKQPFSSPLRELLSSYQNAKYLTIRLAMTTTLTEVSNAVDTHSEGGSASPSPTSDTANPPPVAAAAAAIQPTSTAEGATTNAQGGRVYIPKSSGSWSKTQQSSTPTDANSSNTNNKFPPKPYNNNNKTPSNGQYNNRGNSYNKPNQGGRSNSLGDGPSVQLTKPLLMIQYRYPKVMSDEKKRLLALQQQYRADDVPRYRSQGGSGGGGGYNSYSPSGGGGRGSDSSGQGGNNRMTKQDVQFFNSLIIPPKALSGNNNNNKLKKTKQQLDDERKARIAASRKSKEQDPNAEFEDDDDDEMFASEDQEEEEMTGGEGTEQVEEEYYDDESTTSMASIPPYMLMNLDQEGYSYEDMQVMLYAEYGVKATIAAIVRKLRDEESGKSTSKKKFSKTGKTRRDRHKARQAKFGKKEDTRISLPLNDQIPLKELATLMDIGSGELIKHLMINEGMMVTMNQNIPRDVAIKILEVFGKEWKDDMNEDNLDKIEEQVLSSQRPTQIVPRPPVVTIMGHVDHGKTSLLDKIRNSRVAAKEAGGITQSISAFDVVTSSNRHVTFIDTPGHAAFSAMRTRGAKITDVVVLVIAADDGVMEQTKECIDAARLANCPIIVAINKIDKEGADVEKVKLTLLNFGLMIEEYGGEVQCIPISAKTGEGIDSLLEGILVQSDVMSLTTDINAAVDGSVVEASIDKGLGVVATTIVQSGIIKVGDPVVIGPAWGKIRLLLDDKGKSIPEARASMPIRIIGLNKVPSAGDKLLVAKSEEEAKEMASSREKFMKIQSGSASKANIRATAANFASGDFDTRQQVKVPVIFKADVDGSMEAIKAALEEIVVENADSVARVDIVLSHVGEVTISDVSIAAAAKGMVVAFNVAASTQAMDAARSSQIEIKYYNVLYDLLDELRAKVKAAIAPVMNGELIGSAKVKKIFKIGKVGKVAGCEVVTGRISKLGQARILRDGKTQMYLGPITSLKFFKDEVEEVSEGKECGISFKEFEDLQENDIIECYTVSSAASSKATDGDADEQ